MPLNVLFLFPIPGRVRRNNRRVQITSKLPGTTTGEFHSYMQNKQYYLTEQGLQKTRRELERLKRMRRRKLKKEVPEAIHSEDLNPEYLNFRKELGFIEKKIAKLEEVLKNVEVIKTPGNRNKKVCLGSRVTVEANGQEDKFDIVGTMEADPYLSKISNESLVGQALLGAKEGEEITVSSKVKVVYKIKKVENQK